MRSPPGTQKLVECNDLAFTFHKAAQQAPLYRSEVHVTTIYRQPVCAKIDRQMLIDYACGLVPGTTAALPQMRSNARQKFVRVEGLDDIIDGTRVESPYPVRQERPGGEHDYWNVRLVAQPVENREAVLVGQVDVEENQVRVVLVCTAQPLAGVGSDGEAISGVLEDEA